MDRWVLNIKLATFILPQKVHSGSGSLVRKKIERYFCSNSFSRKVSNAQKKNYKSTYYYHLTAAKQKWPKNFNLFLPIKAQYNDIKMRNQA